MSFQLPSPQSLTWTEPAERVLKDTPKPPAELTVPKADEVVRFCPQDEVLQTPVTAEALTSLYNLIKQDAVCLIRRAHSVYRGTYGNSQVPPEYPLPSVPFFRIKIDFFSK